MVTLVPCLHSQHARISLWSRHNLCTVGYVYFLFSLLKDKCNYNLVSLYTSIVYHLCQSTGCICYTVHVCVDIYSCLHTYLCMIYLSWLTFLLIINKFLGGKVLLLKYNLSMAFWKKPCR